LAWDLATLWRVGMAPTLEPGFQPPP